MYLKSQHYTNHFPLLWIHVPPPRTPNHQFTIRHHQQSRAAQATIARWREIPHRRTSLNVHSTTGYHCGPSCHPQTLNTMPHCGTSHRHQFKPSYPLSPLTSVPTTTQTKLTVDTTSATPAAPTVANPGGELSASLETCQTCGLRGASTTRTMLWCS